MEWTGRTREVGFETRKDSDEMDNLSLMFKPKGLSEVIDLKEAVVIVKFYTFYVLRRWNRLLNTLFLVKNIKNCNLGNIPEWPNVP